MVVLSASIPAAGFPCRKRLVQLLGFLLFVCDALAVFKNVQISTETKQQNSDTHLAICSNSTVSCLTNQQILPATYSVISSKRKRRFSVLPSCRFSCHKRLVRLLGVSALASSWCSGHCVEVFRPQIEFHWSKGKGTKLNAAISTAVDIKINSSLSWPILPYNLTNEPTL